MKNAKYLNEKNVLLLHKKHGLKIIGKLKEEKIKEQEKN